MPARILISVDFPAPFSPTRAWISPASTWMETPSSARTPGKLFPIAVISSSGAAWAAMGGLLSVDLAFLGESVLDDGVLQVVLIYDDRFQEDGRDVLLAIVNFGVCLHSLAASQG